MLYWLDKGVVVRRNTYANDKSSLATVFTNVPSSIQQDDVPIGISSDGYSSRTFTIFMGTERTIRADDRLIDPIGREFRVIGVKLVTSGNEDYQQISAEEAQD